MITDIAERYVTAMIWNITRFFGLSFFMDYYSIHRDFRLMFEKFSMPPLYLDKKVHTDYSSDEFTVHCNSEVEILCEYYFGIDGE